MINDDELFSLAKEAKAFWQNFNRDSLIVRFIFEIWFKININFLFC